MTSDSFPLSALSNQLADAIEQIGPSIVTIQADGCHPASGLVWQPDIVVTIDHAVTQEEDLPIVLPDGRAVTASLIGRDSSTDLAVLRLPEANLPLPTLSETALRVGHLVLAVGRSGEGSLSATFGMIGKLGGSWRSWQGGQIDQYIRPYLMAVRSIGGSALLDSEGKLIGLNTHGPRHSILTIPASTIQRVVGQLVQTGRIAQGYLGVSMQNVPIPERLSQTLNLAHSVGVMLLSVAPDSPADRAGLLIGDVLIALDDQPITDVGDVRMMLSGDRIGQTLVARVLRGGAITEVSVTVGEKGVESDR